jgi:AraC family transcriptional regulator of adaptative response / DNA-3-methyladenine glycosylase II
VTRLRALPGIGEWTAQYIVMRELREPDAFPAGDVGLLRALTDSAGRRPSSRELLATGRALATLACICGPTPLGILHGGR